MYIVSQRENLQAAYDNEQNRYLIKDISTGKDVELSEGEFSEIGSAFRNNYSYELFLRKLEYRGIVLIDGGLPDGPAREFSQIKNQVPEECLAVMLDTTTIFNALYCVGLQPNVNPIALLDLSVLTFAALCFDHIIVQPFYGSKYLSRYPDIFIVMNYPNMEFVSDYLHSLRADYMCLLKTPLSNCGGWFSFEQRAAASSRVIDLGPTVDGAS